MLVLIDNYDSFTYNLVQYLGDLGVETRVVRNDRMSATEIFALSPRGIMISPGPSDPDHAGICLEVIGMAADRDMPLLGVCLGHQAIGQHFGGRVVRGEQPVHGKVHDILHEGGGVFAGIPAPFSATRYHSLVIERATLPPCLAATAWTQDGVIMGLSHKSKPIHGVQFHPESIATQHGHEILNNFTRLLP